jgi:hypothetical protein
MGYFPGKRPGQKLAIEGEKFLCRALAPLLLGMIKRKHKLDTLWKLSIVFTVIVFFISSSILFMSPLTSSIMVPVWSIKL